MKFSIQTSCLLLILSLTLSALPTFADGGIEIKATMCKNIKGDDPVEPTTQFSKDIPEIFAVWSSSQTKKGQSLNSVWIAEDVGQVAPPNTKIVEKAFKLEDGIMGKIATSWSGHFSLTRPTNGWPVGKYRLELYLDNKLIKTLPFTIQ